MPDTELTKLKKRLEKETDPDMKTLLQGKIDALEGNSSSDEGDIDWLDVTEQDWGEVKGHRQKGDFPVELGVGFELSESSIAVPYTTLPSAPFKSEGNYLFPRSSGGAFKSKEFAILDIPYKVHPETGQIGLRVMVDENGVKRYPDFAGKQCRMHFDERKVREGTAEAENSPDGYRGFYGKDGNWYRSIDPVAILPLESNTNEMGV